MGIADDLKTVKGKVGNLLEQYPELRDSDKLLWLMYLNSERNMLEIIGKEAYLKLKAIVMSKDTPSMETIRRIRQKYQEEGFYVGEKRQERLKEAENVLAWAREERGSSNFKCPGGSLRKPIDNLDYDSAFD